MNLDLNLDAGEDRESLFNGKEAELYALVSRVNIACGGHVGDADTMTQAIKLAIAAKVKIGAHPSYPDQKNFGRKTLQVSPSEVSTFVIEQVKALKLLCEKFSQKIEHVKPHGALYNDLAYDPDLARAFAAGIKLVVPEAVLVGLAGSPCLQVWLGLGFQVMGEGFADRGYLSDGRLIPRGQPGALLSDPKAAAEHSRSLLQRPGINTLCVHSDNPAAKLILEAIKLQNV